MLQSTVVWQNDRTGLNLLDSLGLVKFYDGLVVKIKDFGELALLARDDLGECILFFSLFSL